MVNMKPEYWNLDKMVSKWYVSPSKYFEPLNLKLKWCPYSPQFFGKFLKFTTVKPGQKTMIANPTFVNGKSMRHILETFPPIG